MYSKEFSEQIGSKYEEYSNDNVHNTEPTIS